MSSTVTKIGCACLLRALLVATTVCAQTGVAAQHNPGGPALNGSAADTWSATFTPGTSTQYEFESIVHITSEHAQNVKLEAPENCSYRLRAVLKLDFTSSSPDGTVSGRVSFRGVDASLPDCVSTIRDHVTRVLKTFAANPTEFQVYPAGDVHFSRPITPDEPEVISLLRKAAWDVLQRRISDIESAPTPSWRNSRTFLYWPDTFVEDMEVAASTMHYARDVQIGARRCAVFQYKQVFSPTDIPAYVETRSRANDFTGTTLVTGQGGVSLLWDKAERRIVYLHRDRVIDNRLTLQYDVTAQPRHLASFAIEEETNLRWLPSEDTEAWLGNLHKYESSAGESATKSGTTPTRKHPTAQEEISDLLEHPPQGFERWSHEFCASRYCFELSLAVPKGSQVVDEGSGTVLLSGRRGDRNLIVAIGPVLDFQSSGLNADELLRQQTSRFVNNNLWFGRGTGEPINFTSEDVHERPAGATEFRSTSRQLTPTRGRLVMVIGPFERLIPLACAHDEQDTQLDADCVTITESLVLR